MLVRFALVGLAVVGLAAPLGAMEVTSDAAQIQSEGGASDTGAEASPTTTRSRRHRRAQRAPAVQTSAQDVAQDASGQPDAAAGAYADPAALDETADPIPVRKRAPARPKVISALPPSRPAEVASAEPATSPAPTEPAAAAPAAQVAEVAPPAAPQAPAALSGAGRTPAFVSIMPPLRPSFATDTADASVPSGTTGVSVISDDGRVTGAKFVDILPPARPGFASDDNGAPLPGELAAAAPQQPAEQPSLVASLFSTPSLPAIPALPSFAGSGRSALDAMIAAHAKANGVPVELVHRVVVRESRYNPRAVGHGGALGLMQIKHATARALGYVGPASGLLDAETNLTYAVKYLAGAYRTAGGDFSRAVSYYARGYYHAAKNSIRVADRRIRRGFQQDADAGADEQVALTTRGVAQ